MATFLLCDWVHISIPESIWRCRPQIPCWQSKASSCTCWGHTLGSQSVAWPQATCSQAQAYSCNFTWLQHAHSACFDDSQAPELTSRSLHAAINMAQGLLLCAVVPAEAALQGAKPVARLVRFGYGRHRVGAHADSHRITPLQLLPARTCNDASFHHFEQLGYLHTLPQDRETTRPAALSMLEHHMVMQDVCCAVSSS